MLSIEIKMTSVSNTTEMAEVQRENKTECLLLIIVIKLTILVLLNLVKACNKLYKKHNEKVINQHTKSLKEFTSSNAQRETV